MERRSFLALGAVAALVASRQSDAAENTRCRDAEEKEKMPSDVDGDIYIPGYWPGSAYVEGKSVFDHKRLSRAVPLDYRGSVRMLTRLGLNGEVAQALFPVHGHDVAVSSDGKKGFFGSLEHQSYVSFDPKTLDLIAIGKPFKEGWIGGGHGAYWRDGQVLALSERAPKVGYQGKPEKHFGRISLRDPHSLKVIETYSSYGISPHDIRLLADGEHLAIANYGSTYPKGQREYGVPRHIVEPSIAVINLNDGKLVEKFVSGSSSMELRHLCAHDMDTIFAIQTELGLAEQDQPFQTHLKTAYEKELTVPDSLSYLPAPTVKVDRSTNGLSPLGSENIQRLMRHGLSIEYEPTFEEVIATYPASHSIMVFDAKSGELKRHIDCSRTGLDYPCGIVMLKDPRYYVVAGYWKNLCVFERGTHQLMRELCHYNVFFGHSHITAA